MEPKNTNSTDFLFRRPDYVDELDLVPNIALAQGALSSRMVQEERTRVVHPDGRRENVAEHAFMLSKVARNIASVLYPWMDQGKIAIYAADHDDIEGYVGDTPTDVLAQHDPAEKRTLELLGLEQLVEEFAPLAPDYVADLVTYEKQEEYEAQFVRIVDKMMVLVIHVANEGKTLRENYTYEQYVASTCGAEQTLLDQYPHFIELITMRTELALYIGNKYIRDWQNEA